MLLSRPLAVGAGNTGASAFRAVVLWDSDCLAGLIAAAYPLKPCGTAALVSLGEGAFGLPRRGHVASRCIATEPPSYCAAYHDLSGATQGGPCFLHLGIPDGHLGTALT